MSAATPAIRSVKARAVIAPISRPVKNAFGVIEAAEAITAGASYFIMPDLMKVGGVTGWLRVAGQAEAASIPMSSHLFAEASSHMLAVTPSAHWLEVLDLARAVLAEPIEIVDGTVTARGPGLGLEWDETAVTKYLA
jgi:mandelate racemase